MIVIIGIVFAGFLLVASMEKSLKYSSDITISNVDLSMIEDGVYTGSYEQFLVAAEVKVTITNHVIRAY